MAEHSPARVLALALLALPGCGATTVRLAGGPNVSTSGKPGGDAMLSLGIGWPLDWSRNRSHHFIQARAAIGGGLDGETRRGSVAAGLDVDWIHWLEPKMDLRGGAHAAVLPFVYANDASWLVTHVCIGPELRGEVLWRSIGGRMGLFSLPLVIEGNWLAAGD